MATLQKLNARIQGFPEETTPEAVRGVLPETAKPGPAQLKSLPGGLRLGQAPVLSAPGPVVFHPRFMRGPDRTLLDQLRRPNSHRGRRDGFRRMATCGPRPGRCLHWGVLAQQMAMGVLGRHGPTLRVEPGCRVLALGALDLGAADPCLVRPCWTARGEYASRLSCCRGSGRAPEVLKNNRPGAE